MIEKVQASLKWPVLKKPNKNGNFEIVSDPISKTHTIFFPAPSSPAGLPREIEFLHELIHAELAETVHPQFSASYFSKGTTPEVLNVCAWAVRGACDWFVDHRLWELEPKAEEAEIAEHLEYVISAMKSGRGDVFLLLSGAMIIAQAIKYLQIDIPTSGLLKAAVEAFLSVTPERPNIGKLQRLINKLLKLYCNHQVRLVKDSEMEVWKV